MHLWDKHAVQGGGAEGVKERGEDGWECVTKATEMLRVWEGGEVSPVS